jgi:EAL domain-containing protein (putative c-di-GMP-specific phosphodiesterase class I)
LSQLQTLPFDRIKIYRSFINSLGENEQSAAIVETITALGRSLNVPITAEGVETPAVREKLASLGCADAQGWYLGRAVAGHVASMQFAAKVEQPTEQGPLADRNRAGAGRKW